MDEKEQLIEKKGKQLLNLQTEKKKVEQDLIDLHDHMDIKERKIAVLQRKVRNFTICKIECHAHMSTFYVLITRVY